MTQPDPTTVPERPPITEVVCGWVYDALALDPLLLGIYWDQRKDEFPKRQLQPAVFDGPAIVFGHGASRAMLDSADSSVLLQIQHDRFFMNWRGSGERYPRFTGGNGREGLLPRALSEFDRFGAFCEARLAARPHVRRLELTKVDRLRRGVDWSDLEDLGRLVPVTATFGPVHAHGRREIALRFVERRGPETVLISLQSLFDDPSGEMTAVQIETRVMREVEDGDDTSEVFRSLNQEANRVFFELVLDAARFGIQRESRS